MKPPTLILAGGLLSLLAISAPGPDPAGGRAAAGSLLAAEATPLSASGTHAGGQRRPNRLAKEKSPYLLQHAYNPVDWYAWGDEAFKAARERDVPIFLSIGYSTCHWCHVMERESFENDEVAAFLNERFVAIKVDREERPDVDAIYMTAVQAMTGSGGWPLNSWLTHDLKPFYGGTYFPPDDRFGRPGFMEVLHRIDAAWQGQREKIIASGTQIFNAINKAPATESTNPGPALLGEGEKQLRGSYDSAYGGFGRAPKFPRAHEISFLLRQHKRTPDPALLAMIEHTLKAMADGGMYDQLGGGFHRYSTDAKWLVPHFEKMLYDQAILAKACLEAYQVTKRPEYARVAREIFTYALRDLRDAGGAFHSAEDADSEGEEGRFYVWKPGEITAALGLEAAAAFNAYYGVTQAGNFEDGASILHVTRSLEEVAGDLAMPPEALRNSLSRSREKLFAVREKRIRPHLDDKVLTDWNGLFISALAFGGAVLDEPAFTAAAREAAEFIFSKMQEEGRLLHRYRDGEATIPGFLDDYAFFGNGLLDLYEATFEPRWLAESARLAKQATELFRDEADGAFSLVGTHGEQLIIRTKEVYDGAVPSGNSVAATWLLRLGELTVDTKLQETGRGILAAFGSMVARHPAGFPYYLMGLELAVEPTREIVIAGDPSAPATAAMLRAVRERFLPEAVVALHPPGAEGEAIRRLVPFIAQQVEQEGRPTAYVCRNYACERPTTELPRFIELLEAKPGRTAAGN